MRCVANSATTIRTMAPTRSDQGARLKSSHHTRTSSPPTTPPITAYNMESGTTMGTTNQTSHCDATATTPGNSRRGFLGAGSSAFLMFMPVSGLVILTLSVESRLDWRRVDETALAVGFDSSLDERLTARLDVVGPQCPEISNVKPPVRNHRIRKRLLSILPRLFTLRLSRRSVSALFAIRPRVPPTKYKIPILVVNVKIPIGAAKRPHAVPLGLPFHLPRSELSRDQL